MYSILKGQSKTPLKYVDNVSYEFLPKALGDPQT